LLPNNAAGTSSWRLGRARTMSTIPDPNSDQHSSDTRGESAGDGSTSTDQMLEDAEGPVATEILDAPDLISRTMQRRRTRQGPVQG
jgi:hypothetical protein